jgi:hypothetical protein
MLSSNGVEDIPGSSIVLSELQVSEGDRELHRTASSPPDYQPVLVLITCWRLRGWTNRSDIIMRMFRVQALRRQNVED